MLYSTGKDKKQNVFIFVCFYNQVKPKKAIVKDVSKKANKDIGDPAGIFMGEREYILLLV